jgi:RNA polymerase sigma-70 factor, ECF subfamily
MIERLNFKFGKRAIDARVDDNFRRIEERTMQNTNASVGTKEREEIPNEGGSAQQLEQILASGLPPLYRRAYRMLGNAADAEDAVQDALLAACTHLHQFRGQAQISTWLTTIMLNCARLQLRRRAKHVQVSLDECTGEPQPVSVSERLADHRPNPEDEYRESELSTRLTHLHSQLSPALRRTFQLRDVDGLSIRETARILGVPTGTVKAQSARARKKLKELMRRTLRPRSRRLPNRWLRFTNSAVHPGALRLTHMARELFVDSESDRADVLVEAAHETIR